MMAPGIHPDVHRGGKNISFSSSASLLKSEVLSELFGYFSIGRILFVDIFICRKEKNRIMSFLFPVAVRHETINLEREFLLLKYVVI